MDLVNVDVGVGVDHADEELLDRLVVRVADGALDRILLVVDGLVLLRLGVVGVLDVLVLVVLHVPFLVVAWNELSADPCGIFATHLRVLDVAPQVRRWVRWRFGLVGLGFDSGGCDWSLLIRLVDALAHVVVELSGARLAGLHLVEVDTSELLALVLQVLDKLLEELHRHLLWLSLLVGELLEIVRQGVTDESHSPIIQLRVEDSVVLWS